MDLLVNVATAPVQTHHLGPYGLELSRAEILRCRRTVKPAKHSQRVKVTAQLAVGMLAFGGGASRIHFLHGGPECHHDLRDRVWAVLIGIEINPWPASRDPFADQPVVLIQ